MILFIDDVRPYDQAHSAIVVRNSYAALRVLTDNPDLIHLISFDHDLGNDSKSGYDIAKWIERETFEGRMDKQFQWQIHSANPVGRKNIEACMQAVDAYWTKLTDAIGASDFCAR